jgi:predicted NBD/HSP70 family sugar kinase
MTKKKLSGTNLVLAGDHNQRVVLQAVRLTGEVTRPELASLTGLTLQTVLNITKRLQEAGLVVELGKRRGARGQPASRLSINAQGCFAIGINIDRDHLAMVVLDLSGHVMQRSVIELSFPMPSDVTSFVSKEFRKARKQDWFDREKIIGVGIAIPDGIAEINVPDKPAEFSEWDNIDIKRLVANILPFPIYADNDAAAASLGEAEFGIGKNERNFFYLLLSVGLGGGVVIEGSYYRGARGRSGEIGYLPIGGSPLSLESIVSRSGLIAEFKQHYQDRKTPWSGEFDSPADVGIVNSWIEKSADALVDPLININFIINPTAIVLGGRLPKNILENLADAVNKKLDQMKNKPFSLAPLEISALSEDAPAIGAAIIALSANLLPSGKNMQPTSVS